MIGSAPGAVDSSLTGRRGRLLSHRLASPAVVFRHAIALHDDCGQLLPGIRSIG